MPFWQFLEYITENRENPFADWYGTLGGDAQAEVDIFLETLSETEDWDEARPGKRKYKELCKQHAGLCQLMLKVDRKRLRLIGALRRERREFVLLGGCEKHGLWTVPLRAFDDAMKLKLRFDEGRGTTRALI